jgi:hypothetical protein
MALKKCPDCQKDISDSAAACPFCGRPNEKTWDEMTPLERGQKMLDNMDKCPNCRSTRIGNIPIGLTFFGMRTKKCWACGKTW